MQTLFRILLLTLLVAACSGENASHNTAYEEYWPMHVIDDEFDGADGVDLADIDGDGDADAVVGWEESGELILHENPGPALVRKSWGRTRISGGLAVGKIEDARFADFNGDGLVDAVVSATEKRSERVGVHWLVNRDNIHSPDAWRGSWLDQSLRYLYLKIAVGQIDGRGGRDIVVGSKADGKAGGLVWYQAPPAPHADNADQWRSRFIDDIEWADSVSITDINGDGRNDILLNHWNNLVWYENTGEEVKEGKPGPGWEKHRISDTTKSYFADCSGDSRSVQARLLVAGADISEAGAGDVVLYLVGKAHNDQGLWTGEWLQREIRSIEAVPREAGEREYQIKSIACGNIDDNENLDIVISISGRGNGVFALMNLENTIQHQSLHLQVISSDSLQSHKGIKHDDVVLEDLDRDGDLDIVTTEENGSSGLLNNLLPGFSSRGLGLIWFENPGNSDSH